MSAGNAVAVIVAAALAVALAVYQTPRPSAVTAASAARVVAVFGQRDNTAGAGVARLFLGRLPADWPTIKRAEIRKQGFVGFMLPLVLKANELILADRRRVETLLQRRQRDGRLAPRDRKALSRLAKRYRVGPRDGAELLRRMDIIPPSLAIAQGAVESGWGTSRFSLQGNALFGQWTWGEAAGIVPEQREAGKTHKIRKFPDLAQSVRAYMRNLNVHRAYGGLRAVRFARRQAGQAMDGLALTGSLVSYSERGMDYVNSLRFIIRSNGLDDLDSARLMEKSFKQ